jgi:carbon-monoxide dehydrogenase medium subunit
VEEAGALQDQHGDDAAVICGGTELLLVYKLGFADYPHLVDVKGIAELGGIAAENGTIRIGAGVTHREIEHSPVIREQMPELAEMERHVGNLRVRNVGTIGGNLCFADPHSDPATFLLAADGAVTCRRGGAPARRLGVEAFARGPFETALEAGELLVSVEVPRPAPGTVLVHRKMSFHERPAITVAARVRAGGGAVEDVRLAIGSVGTTPVLVSDAAGPLLGTAPGAVGDAALDAAGDAAAAAVRPIEDANGSVEYKRQLARVLARRCLREALDRV